MAVSDVPDPAVASTDQWPDPEPGQIQVLLLGTYHMDNPGLDEVNVEADDVLAPTRQAELRRLADGLEAWGPDRVAVERPYDRRSAVNDLYEAYRSGEYDYDEEVAFEPRHPKRDDTTNACRSEVVQIGFRLADRLDHDAVAPVDAPAMLGNDDVETLLDGEFEPERKADVSVRDSETVQAEVSERLADSTIPEYLSWANREEQLAYNHRAMFDRFFRYGDGDNLGGPEVLSTWYDRNLRMAHYLWRALERGDDRALFVVGSGHVRVLRHFLRESPATCPVSAVPLLEAITEA